MARFNGFNGFNDAYGVVCGGMVHCLPGWGAACALLSHPYRLLITLCVRSVLVNERACAHSTLRTHSALSTIIYLYGRTHDRMS